MPTDFGAQLKAIDQVALTPVVRRSLNSDTLEIVNWNYRPLQGGDGDSGTGASGIYRFAGHCQDRDERRPWSLILKACSSQLGGDDASDWDYWQRELLAYQSGFLDKLPGGLAAPRCFGAMRSAESFWVWLEDVTDEIGLRWPLERYALAARHLGQFNGACLVGQPLPSFSWLSTGWLRSLLTQEASLIAKLREPLTHPLQRRLFSTDVVAGLLKLWAESKSLLDVLDGLPQTLCHRDAFRRNLFARHNAEGREQTVAIDWAFTGIAAVGEELAPLVTGSLVFFEVEMDQARELDHIVFEGYLDGLRDSGWRGDARRARFGYLVASALCYGIGYLPDIDNVPDEGWRTRMEQMMGRSIEEVLEGWATCYRLVLNQADEARGLLASLDENDAGKQPER